MASASVSSAADRVAGRRPCPRSSKAACGGLHGARRRRLPSDDATSAIVVTGGGIDHRVGPAVHGLYPAPADEVRPVRRGHSSTTPREKGTHAASRRGERRWQGIPLASHSRNQRIPLPRVAGTPATLPRRYAPHASCSATARCSPQTWRVPSSRAVAVEGGRIVASTTSARRPGREAHRDRRPRRRLPRARLPRRPRTSALGRHRAQPVRTSSALSHHRRDRGERVPTYADGPSRARRGSRAAATTRPCVPKGDRRGRGARRRPARTGPVVLEASDHHIDLGEQRGAAAAGNRRRARPTRSADASSGTATAPGRHARRSGVPSTWSRRCSPSPDRASRAAATAWRWPCRRSRRGASPGPRKRRCPRRPRVYLAALARAGLLTMRVNVAFRAEPGRWPAQPTAVRRAPPHGASADPAVRRPRAAPAPSSSSPTECIEAGTGFLLEPYADTPHTLWAAELGSRRARRGRRGLRRGRVPDPHPRHRRRRCADGARRDRARGDA